MEARISAIEAQLKINSHPKEGDVMKKEGETSADPAWGRNRGNLAVTHQILGDMHKESSWLLGS